VPVEVSSVTDRRSTTEQVAIIGMGCRFAGGADSPEAFWELLRSGREAISEIPPDRWISYADAGPDYAAVLRQTTRWGGFLTDIEGFDAEFFGISPREAELMDPQQRLLLEVAWEALENAGIPPHRLAATDTGVFVGIGSDDYGRRLLEDLPRIEAWTGIGAACCAVANRISYTLDLRGPSLAVDTACSASLVALHLACQSLRDGESTLALAAGVNLIVAPGLSVTLDRAGATSPDGRCKSFDATADGYGRGEGGGVLVLKRLADARRDGDRMLAVIRGGAVNQDGRTNGIMAPSGEAQEHLLRRAYRHAGVAPDTVDYVEAHGTGTVAGDPIEAGALGAVLGAGRPADRPCLIGSVKSNIGHLEAGSGVAGVIKAVLALTHGEIPPSVNFSRPNPHIPWSEAGLRVLTEVRAWPRGDRPRRAGVSGYGYGGTIAHIVLEEAPDPPPVRPVFTAPAGTPVLFPLSGRSTAAVAGYAGRLADWLAGPGVDTPLDAVAHTLADRHSHLEHRAVVLAADRAELASGLRTLAAAEAAANTTGGPVLRDTDAGPVWVFSGHGAQWSGMGRELLAAEPSFAAAVDALGPVFATELGCTPRQVLTSGELGGVDLIQPMIFAMQVGLAAVWRGYGVRPAAIIGHSVGEIAAAVAAGVLDPTDGARLVCRRSRLLRRVAGAGRMAMVNLPFDEARDQVADYGGVVAAIAASPTSTVVAGDPTAIGNLITRWAAEEDLMVRDVASDVAFHSPQMDPLLDELAAGAADLRVRAPQVPLYGTALDDPRDRAPRDGAYWAANLRNPVRFAGAVSAAIEDGHRIFLEVSAHPVVTHSIIETLTAEGVYEHRVVGSLRRGRPECATLRLNLGTLHCAGVPIDWTAVNPTGDLVTLPTTVWQRRRHWRQSAVGGSGIGQHGLGSHALLGPQTTIHGSTPVSWWRTYLDLESRPYPGSHTIHGSEIVPAAVLVQTFLAAAAAVTDGQAAVLSDVDLALPLSLACPREVQVVAQDGRLRLASRPADRAVAGHADPDRPTAGTTEVDGWLTHASAASAPGVPLVPASVPGAPLVPAPAPGPSRAGRAEAGDDQGEELDAGYVGDYLASVGVPSMAFPWRIERLIRTPRGLRAHVTAGEAAGVSAGEEAGVNAGKETVAAAAATWAPLLDAALSIAPAAFAGPAALRTVAGLGEVRADGPAPATARIDVEVITSSTVQITVEAPDGSATLRLSVVRYAGGEAAPVAVASPARLLHEITWRPLPTGRSATAATTPRDATLVVVGEHGPLATALRSRAAGVGCRHLAVPDAAALDEVAGRVTGSVMVVLLPPAATGPGTAVDAVDAAWTLADVARRLTSWTRAKPTLWSLTTGVREAAGLGAVVQAPRWGLGRVIASEHPELWGGTVDLAPADPAGDVDALFALLVGQRGEDVVALRQGKAEVARLVPASGQPTRPPLRCRPDGTYLITGGLGSLGVEIGRWLVGRGARRLVLAGRSPLPPRGRWPLTGGAQVPLSGGAQVPVGSAPRPRDDDNVRERIAAVQRLEALGVAVKVIGLDIADQAAAAAALSPDALGMPPIRGVVHAAGVLDNRLLDDLDRESLATVMRPKVDGALTLRALFPPGTLDFLVHFSSCGLLLGLAGQASYAAANCVLDALAVHDHAAGDPGVMSLGWTSWRGMGMAVSEAVDAELRACGVGDVAPAVATATWERASRLDTGYLAVLPTTPLGIGARRPRLLADLPEDAADEAAPGGGEPAGFSWHGPAADVSARLLDESIRQVAAELKVSAAELDPGRPLVELGLDSVLALIIRRRLESRFQLRLPATLLWHRPTVAAVVDYLMEYAPDPSDAHSGPSPAGSLP
jgi:6-methylsalicylic acid synthase